MRASEGVLDQPLCALRVRDARVELGDLELGQPSPVSTAAAPGGEQPTDLGEREPGVPAEADQRDAFRAPW